MWSSVLVFLQAYAVDQFGLEGDPIDIEKAMNTKFGRRLTNHTYKLHKQLRELKDAKGGEYARNHPPKDVGPTKWIDLIDKKWNTTKFLKQSKANIANREKMKTKHRCGSRSISIRVEKLAREKKMLPDLAEFYKETHYNEETHEWISFEAQAHYMDHEVSSLAAVLKITRVTMLNGGFSIETIIDE